MLLGISVVVFLLKHFIIWFLYTPEFYPMEALFVWQLAGDFFKICSWLLAFLMVAKAKALMYISTEVLFTITYIVLSYLFVQINGVVGLTQGYLVAYFLYMLAMVFLFRNVIKVKKV